MKKRLLIGLIVAVSILCTTPMIPASQYNQVEKVTQEKIDAYEQDLLTFIQNNGGNILLSEKEYSISDETLQALPITSQQEIQHIMSILDAQEEIFNKGFIVNLLFSLLLAVLGTIIGILFGPIIAAIILILVSPAILLAKIIQYIIQMFDPVLS